MPTLTWINSTGVETALAEVNGYKILRGVTGLNVAPRSLTADDLVSSDGSLPSQSRFNRRYVVLPMMLTSQGTRVLDVIGAAARMFMGPGELRHADATTTRTLRNVHYETGLGGDQSTDLALTDLWRKVAVSLVAMDPWWYGVNQTILLTFGTPSLFNSASIPFSHALTPFDGGDATAINVNGDAAASWVLKLTGPMNAGAVIGGIQLANALASGDVLTISSQPGQRGPRWKGGAIDWSWLTPQSRLFTLPVGSSVVAVGVSGTSGVTSFELSLSERWLTP